jgi:hypothetical protein
MFETLARPRAWPRPWAAAVCASLFFLGSADQFFAVRVQGITLRLAQVVLCAALVVWWQTKRKDSPEDNRRLLIAWAPFLGVFLLATLLSADPLPGLLKLAWFGFNFLGAYAWCRLFEHEDLVRGYFSAYLLVAAVIVFDFLIGFGGGPAHMIGYAQPTYGVPRHEGWFRPHAFYYEPSYAAAGLGLAWALALTPLYVYAPKTSAAVVLGGGAALVMTFSRTGCADRGRRYRRRRRKRLADLVAPQGRLSGCLRSRVAGARADPNAGAQPRWRADAHAGARRKRDRRTSLSDRQRVVPSWDLQCLEGEERARALPFNRPGVPPERTSEGSRLMALKAPVVDSSGQTLRG